MKCQAVVPEGGGGALGDGVRRAGDGEGCAESQGQGHAGPQSRGWTRDVVANSLNNERSRERRERKTEEEKKEKEVKMRQARCECLNLPPGRPD